VYPSFFNDVVSMLSRGVLPFPIRVAQPLETQMSTMTVTAAHAVFARRKFCVDKGRKVIGWIMVSSVAYASRALRPYPTSFFGNQPNPPKEKILPFGKVYLDRRNLSERPMELIG
jgi:hypothetical protein